MSVKVTFLGHSGVLIEGGGARVAIDPFLNDNPVATMKADELECDAVVLTHGHEDHMADAVPICKKNKATLYAAYEICGYAQEEGHEKCEPGNPGGKIEAPFGFVAFTQAFHSSSFKGRYMGMPCGVVVNIGGVTLYHMGDTALFGDMKLLGEIYKPDVAFVPVGDRFTMGPELGKRAAELVRPKIAVPVHYKTWPLLAQDITAFRPEGVQVRALEPGETMTVG